MGSWFVKTFAALSNTHFRTLWTGSFLAFIAFFMSITVNAIVAFDLSGSNGAVGFVVFGQGIAQLLLNPIGGALADRLPKKVVILSCQAVITVAFFVLGILVVTDVIAVAYLAIGSFLIGMSFSFLGPSRQSFLMELVDVTRRGNAVALSQVALNASRIIAPLLATFLLGVEAFGAAGAFFAMSALYIAAMLTTFRLPKSNPPANAGRSMFGDLIAGFGYVKRTPRLRLLIASYVLTIMFGFAFTTVLPGLLENELDRKAKDITLLLAANAIGGLVASLAVASLADSPRANAVYLFMCSMFGICLVWMGVVPSYGVLVLVMLIMGFAAGGFQTLNGAIVSHITDPAYFGRVVALTFLAFAASSVLALPLGFIADAVGERPTLLVSGAIVCLLTLSYFLLERVIADPAPHAAATSDAAAG